MLDDKPATATAAVTAAAKEGTFVARIERMLAKPGWKTTEAGFLSIVAIVPWFVAQLPASLSIKVSALASVAYGITRLGTKIAAAILGKKEL